MTFNSSTENEEHDIPSQIFEDHFWIAYLSYFLHPNMCGFQNICRVLRFPTLLECSGQLAELIVYIILPE